MGGDVKNSFDVADRRRFLISTIYRREYYIKGGISLKMNNHNINYWLDSLGGMAGVW